MPKFTNLKTLSFIGCQKGDIIIFCLYTLLQKQKEQQQGVQSLSSQNFTCSLETIELNGSTFNLEDSYIKLNEVIINLPSIQNLKFIGTSIGENLGELCPCFKLPSIKSIDLQYNGIEQNFMKSYFQYMFDFSKLEQLNLGSNWFGT